MVLIGYFEIVFLKDDLAQSAPIWNTSGIPGYLVDQGGAGTWGALRALGAPGGYQALIESLVQLRLFNLKINT